MGQDWAGCRRGFRGKEGWRKGTNNGYGISFSIKSSPSWKLDISLVIETEVALSVSTPFFCVVSLLFHSSVLGAVLMLLREYQVVHVWTEGH